jgi:hypothetical protein
MLTRHLAVLASCTLVAAAGCSRKLDVSPTSKADPGSTSKTDPSSTSKLIPSSLVPDLSGVVVNSATGHVESTGSTGAWSFDSGTCYAGDNDGYFGIQVESKTDEHVFIKFVKDPIQGWTLLAAIPSTCRGTKCTLQVFRPEQCKPLDVNLKVYTFRKGGTHQFDGDVTFDCTHDKAHVSGKLTVTRCVN